MFKTKKVGQSKSGNHNLRGKGFIANITDTISWNTDKLCYLYF